MNKLERRQEGIKRARKILRVFRGTMVRRHDDYYSDGGLYEQVLRKTRKPCSCLGCGNRRNTEGPTRQERKALGEI